MALQEKRRPSKRGLLFITPAPLQESDEREQEIIVRCEGRSDSENELQVLHTPGNFKLQASRPMYKFGMPQIFITQNPSKKTFLAIVPSIVPFSWFREKEQCPKIRVFFYLR